MNDYDVLDVVLCHAALAQDSPEVPPSYQSDLEPHVWVPHS